MFRVNPFKLCPHFGRPIQQKPSIDPQVFRRLCDLNINRHRRVRRGTRAGFHTFSNSLKWKAPNEVSLCLMNARSIRNKAQYIRDYVLDNRLDIVGITETWLGRDDDTLKIADLVPGGYHFSSVPRSERDGGGIGLLHKSSILTTFRATCKL